VVELAPGRDRHPHAVAQAFLAEVGAELTRRHEHVHRAVLLGSRRDVAHAEERQRANVAVLEMVLSDDRENGLRQIVDRVADAHPVDRCARHQSREVLAKAEHGGALGGWVAADVVEHRAAVVQRVGQQVNMLAFRLAHLAFPPDVACECLARCPRERQLVVLGSSREARPFGWIHWPRAHRSSPVGVRSGGAACCRSWARPRRAAG
jgi:hypothetical protein